MLLAADVTLATARRSDRRRSSFGWPLGQRSIFQHDRSHLDSSQSSCRAGTDDPFASSAPYLCNLLLASFYVQAKVTIHDDESPVPPMKTMNEAPRLFSEVTEITPTAPHVFDAEIDALWSVGGKTHGGYLVALAARAAAKTADSFSPGVRQHPYVLATSTHFYRSPLSGPAVVRTEILHQGRSTTHIRARLSQSDAPHLETIVTLGQLPEPSTTKADWDGGAPHRSTVGVDEAVPFRSPSEVMRVALFDQIELRLDPATLHSLSAVKPSGRGELRGWITLPGGESFDHISLQLAMDAMPPATFDIKFTGWVPTIQLTSYTRALPAPGPVQILHRAHLIDANTVDETTHVWDCTGRLVIQSTQIAAIRF